VRAGRREPHRGSDRAHGRVGTRRCHTPAGGAVAPPSQRHASAGRRPRPWAVLLPPRGTVRRGGGSAAAAADAAAAGPAPPAAPAVGARAVVVWPETPAGSRVIRHGAGRRLTRSRRHRGGEGGKTPPCVSQRMAQRRAARQRFPCPGLTRRARGRRTRKTAPRRAGISTRGNGRPPSGGWFGGGGRGANLLKWDRSTIAFWRFRLPLLLWNPPDG